VVDDENLICGNHLRRPAAVKTTEAGIDANSVRVLSRGLKILRVFAPKNDWLSNHEIASATGLPRSTVSRLAANLTDEGYLEYSLEHGYYRLGAAVLALGYAVVTNIDILEVARPFLQELADSEDALVLLSTRDGLAMVCNEVCYGRNMLTLRVGVGSRLAITTSAVGRALIGTLPDGQRDALLDEIRENVGGDWVLLGPAFNDATAQMREKKFYTSIGTLEQGVNGVGAVLDVAGAPYTYVIGIAAPSFRFEPQLLDQRVGPRLIEIKHEIEQQMASVTRPN